MNNLQKRIFTSIFLIVILLNCVFISSITWVILLSIASLICLSEFYFLNKKIFRNIFFTIAVSTLGGFYLFLFVISAFNTYEAKGEFFVLFILLIIIFSDIGGYVVGKFIGGPKLTKISPNKTISGSIGSFLFSLFPLGFSILIVNSNVINLGIIEDGAVLCLVLSFVSQIGDLIISYFKRLAEVKDTGKFLPGHGGILDRVDGIIFAIPFYYFFWS